ncbi:MULTISPECIES: ABC transporter ATP-binding protein [Pontibacillus]|uniref:ABC transporter ATP-binding protein n=1 Tax=Pontibacillus chungwhensis TaxID=265426 RepID=A0ABY8UZ99_9BACI|nr:ABC transporter ATP-binding protein [Pontibacillus chungwhensis]MCD5324851.1 ABC transporter ATP-binding protein [Pontibacillus sp. HN14]WIF98809.1 ABC transporter ATP-binding protein [Pontibacillus chungwhensis]
MIRFEDVSKWYKRKTVLHPFSLTVREGSSVGIIGPNGAGKSTFLKMVASLERPSKGTVSFYNEPYEKVIKQVRADIGYVPQDIALYEELTVKEQLSFWKKLEPRGVDEGFLEEMIQTLRLNEVFDQRINRLSGGWKRKVNMCIGLLKNPAICLLDEPTAGVDLAAKEDIIGWLQTLHSEGKTLLYISHDWYELNQLSDEYLLFASGAPVFQGSKDRLLVEKNELMQTYNQDAELSRILQYV